MGCNPNPAIMGPCFNRVAVANYGRELPHPNDWHDDYRGGHNHFRASHNYLRMTPVFPVPSTFTN